MNKEAFLAELRSRLSGLPEEDLAERISFYREMIEECVADGQTEEEAVAGIGSPEEIVRQVMAEFPLGRLVGEKVKSRNALKGWQVALLVLGSPLWVPLVIVALAMLFSFYIVLWALVISCWAVDLSLVAGAVASLVSAAVYLKAGNPAGVGFAVGAALTCAGLSILWFHACAWITGAAIRLGRKILLGMKISLSGKETDFVRESRQRERLQNRHPSQNDRREQPFTEED